MKYQGGLLKYKREKLIGLNTIKNKVITPYWRLTMVRWSLNRGHLRCLTNFYVGPPHATFLTYSLTSLYIANVPSKQQGFLVFLGDRLVKLAVLTSNVSP